MLPDKRNRIISLLKAEIRTEGLCSLPGECVISRKYHVCRETIREALKCLAEERLIRRSQGRRTRVNYVPDDKADTILVITTSFQNPVMEIQTVASEHGLRLLVVKEEAFPVNDLDFIDGFTRENHVIGIVFCVSWFFGSEDFCGLFNQLHLPVYLPYISRRFLMKSHCSGGVQETQDGWRLALKHLVALGHVRVATFAPTTKHSFHGVITASYGEMLKGLSLDPSRELWCQRPFHYEKNAEEHCPLHHYEEIREELKRMMALKRPPTAAICYSNQWAAMLYRACGELGIRIPADLSVMGFLSDAEELTPSLATVALQSKDCFREMIANFLASRNGCRQPQLIAENEFVLVEGESLVSPQDG